MTRKLVDQFARRMRRKPTHHEGRLHNALTTAFAARQCMIRPQEIIGSYIADFCIYPSRLVVEVDGLSHTRTAEYDARRDRYMQAQGLRILRVTNAEVQANPAAVAARALDLCADLPMRSDPIVAIKCPPMPASRYRLRKREFVRRP